MTYYDASKRLIVLHFIVGALGDRMKTRQIGGVIVSAQIQYHKNSNASRRGGVCVSLKL